MADCKCSHKYTLLAQEIITLNRFYFIVNTTKYFNILIIL